MSRPHRTSLILVISALLLAAGCAGGEDAVTTGTPAPTAEPTPRGFSVAGEEGTEDGGTGTTTSPGAEETSESPPAPEVPDDPAAVVRAFFDAVHAEDYATQLAASTGPVRTITRVRDIIAAQNADRGAKTDDIVEISASPQVTDTSQDTATVSFALKVTSRVTGPEETRTSEAAITGPARLVRADGSWALEDFVYADDRLSETYIAVDRSESQQGVRLEVASLLSYKATTAAVVRLVNTEGGETQIEVTASLVDTAGEEHDARTVAPDPRSRTPWLFLGFPRVDEPQTLRVTVEDTSSGDHWTYTVEL